MYIINKYKYVNWSIFILLSIIWGSSFVLMKEGLKEFSPVQVGAFRIFSAGLALLPMAINAIRKIPYRKFGVIFLSGLIGNLIPAFLFCEAETGLDSSTAGVLNALTPIFVIVFGILIFKTKIEAIKIIGIAVAFVGTALLSYSHNSGSVGNNFFNIFLVVLATISYGLNVNIVKKYLNDIPSLHVASVALSLNAVPAGIVLAISGYFNYDFSNRKFLAASFYSTILGVFGTALATILFYQLIKRSGIVFASMVTYGIPIIAIVWGIIYGEYIGWKEITCMLIILVGVYITNKKKEQEIQIK